MERGVELIYACRPASGWRRPRALTRARSLSVTVRSRQCNDSKGHLWVADVNNNRIQQWQVPVEKAAYLSVFGANGSGDGQMKTPSSVAVGFGGVLWVADRGNNRIEKFDSSGKFLSKFGSLGSGDGQFNRPVSIAIDRDGNLLVTDTNNNRIEKFNPQGEFLSKFGSAGAGNGQFSDPEGIATTAGCGLATPSLPSATPSTTHPYIKAMTCAPQALALKIRLANRVARRFGDFLC